MNYQLVPPTSKLVEYKSVYAHAELTFMIKVFDFEEHDTYAAMFLKYAKIGEDGKFLKDENGNYILKNDEYYPAAFRMVCPEIKGLKPNDDGKILFNPSWSIIKEIVNEGSSLNNAVNVEK